MVDFNLRTYLTIACFDDGLGEVNVFVAGIATVIVRMIM